jgi:hypothetical protein
MPHIIKTSKSFAVSSGCASATNQRKVVATGANSRGRSSVRRITNSIRPVVVATRLVIGEAQDAIATGIVLTRLRNCGVRGRFEAVLSGKSDARPVNEVLDVRLVGMAAIVLTPGKFSIERIDVHGRHLL